MLYEFSDLTRKEIIKYLMRSFRVHTYSEIIVTLSTLKIIKQ